jgi:hypothetical protein
VGEAERGAEVFAVLEPVLFGDGEEEVDDGGTDLRSTI